jgi:SsrA-binding protein
VDVVPGLGNVGNHGVRHAAVVRPKIATARKSSPAADSAKSNNKVIATNRRARHNYSVLETFEAGVQLVGTEVKSLRDGQASLADAFATIDDGEVWLRNLHIPEYHHGSWTNHTPRRNRKLLLHRSQIDNLIGRIRDGNLTLVPLSLYFSDGKVKVELALARGKEARDKRQDIAKRDADREITRELGRRAKGMT